MGLLPRLSQQAQAEHHLIKRVMLLLLFVSIHLMLVGIVFIKHLPTYLDVTKRQLALLGAGAFATGLLKTSSAIAEEVPKNYKSYVDQKDGYSYLYPAEWRDFDFLGHDSAFKDRNLALQCVRVGFIPTEKKDIRDLGQMDEAIFNLVNNVYAAPNQIPSIYDMQERTVDGKNYWTFEYDLEAPGYGVSAWATVAIGNGRYYTLIVTANERRWSRLRNKLKVVADSFKISDLTA